MQLVPVVNQQEIEKIFLTNLDEQIDLIVEDGDNYVADITTETGRRDCIAKARSIAKQKKIIDDARKALKAQYKAKVDAIDAVGKHARDTLDASRDRVRQPVTDWEAMEEEKLQKKLALLELEMDWDEAIEENVRHDGMLDIARREAEIAKKEAEIAEAERVATERNATKAKEEKLVADAKKWAEEKAAKAVEDARKAKEQAIADKIEAEKKAEIDKAKAVEDARKAEIAKQKIVADKIALDAKNAKDKAEKIAANRNHQKWINRDIAKDLLDELDVPEVKAKMFIIGVLAGKIRHLTINY